MAEILLVDDQPNPRRAIALLLKKQRYSVEEAEDGHAALSKLKNQFFDLVITDVLMPGIDGHGVAQYIRNSGKPHTPIIAMSGTPWLMDGGEFDSVFPKPFSIYTLLNAIDELMPNNSNGDNGYISDPVMRA